MNTGMLRTIVRTLAISIAVGWAGIAVAQPRIAVTIHPYFDLTQRIAGSDAHVVRLLPPGASTHTFDPPPSVVAELERADLVILNGGVDEWALGFVGTGGSSPSVLELLPLYVGFEDLVMPGGHEGQAGYDTHPEHEELEDVAHDGPVLEGVNPHIWLDPVLMEQAVEAIAARLAELDPERAETYLRNAAAVVSELRALDAELRLVLAPVRGAPFIPFHDAWPYFSARYGLDLVLEIEPFPGREPGPRYLASVLESIRSSGARAIFAEAQLGERPARVIAAEAGVNVATLDPIGGVEGRMSYEELLRYNAHTIVEALGIP